MDNRYYQSTINLHGKEQGIILLDPRHDFNNNQSVKISNYHHIQIIDRSGSMYSYIDELIDNIQETISILNPDDLLSIIWFSGPGEFRTLIKGAKKTDNLIPLLDSIRSTVSTTCFSEPLMETEKIMEELAQLCPNFSLTLFTDGCPVVPWGEREEIKRIEKIMERLSGKLISCVTIGYGYYYNQKLLSQIATYGKQGRFFHTSSIKDYLNYFSSIYQNLKELSSNTVTFSGFLGSLLHITPTSFQFYKTVENNDDLVVNLHKDKNLFFLIPSISTLYVNNRGIKVNDVFMHYPRLDEIPIHYLEDFYYSYAYQKMYEDDKEKALDILARNLQDKNFVDKIINVYTYDDRKEFLEELEQSIYKPKGRYLTGKCSDDYIPKDDCLCVMDILKILSEGDCYYLPGSVKNYKRISKKQETTVKLFEASQEETKVPFGDFVFNEEFLNMSLRYMIKGKVNLNQKEAKEAGLDLTSVDGISIFRNHTLVKDGNLNIKEFEVLTNVDTGKEIIDLVPSKYLPKVKMEYGNKMRIAFNFTGLPIINKQYVKGDFVSLDNIFNTTISILSNEVKQKVLKYYIKKIKEQAVISKGLFAELNLTEDQIKVFKNHGITEDRTFNDPFLKPTEKDTDKLDFYIARTFSIDIKGKKSIPSVNDVLKKMEAQNQEGGKKKKEMQGLTLQMANYITDLMAKIAEKKMTLNNVSAELEEYLSGELKVVKKELQKLRMILAVIKMGKILSNTWFDGLNLTDTGDYTFNKDSEIMIIKLDRKKVYF